MALGCTLLGALGAAGAAMKGIAALTANDDPPIPRNQLTSDQTSVAKELSAALGPGQYRPVGSGLGNQALQPGGVYRSRLENLSRRFQALGGGGQSGPVAGTAPASIPPPVTGRGVG